MKEIIRETLWESSEKIFKRKDTVSAKLCVPGLIFLKHMSHAFEQLYKKLKTGEGEYRGADPDDPDEYYAENLVYLPVKSRWKYIKTHVDKKEPGPLLNEAMRNIGEQNRHLRDILPLEYSSPNIKTGKLKAFIKQLGKIPGEHPRSGEILKEMYGFYVRNKSASLKEREEVVVTPVSIEDLLVSMLLRLPMKDPIFDPCCGYGGLLTAVGRFAEIFNEPIEIIKLYGQEKNLTYYRLCCMGLAMYRLYTNNVKYNNKSSLDNEIHNRLQAKTILCAPSCNNNYFSWIQYALSHLASGGYAGLVLPKRSLNTKAGNEDQIRENLLENKSVDCIVSLPGKLFTGKGIPSCLWILAKERGNSQGLCRRPNDEVLFIDAGYKEPVINREISEKMTQNINIAYRQWREKPGDYSDVKGFCKSVCLNKIKAKNFDLSPKLYV